MLPGVRGQLLASGCLHSQLEAVLDAGAPFEARRRFHAARLASRQLGPASSLRSVTELAAEPLAQVLGYACVGPAVAAHQSFLLPLRAGRSLVPWTIAPWGTGLEALWRAAAAAARAQGARWAILCNGTHLRVLDASAVRARRWIEIDLDVAADDAAAFAALWLVGRAEVQADGLAALVEESDAFAAGVSRSLRHGVLRASEDVLAAIVNGRRSADIQAALGQALTVVYRLLFLLFAESRGLVPMWHPVYRGSYSIDALRAAAERGRIAGLWDGVRAVSRLAHAGCRTGHLTVTPFNGRLFDANRAPLVEGRGLDDRAASRAVLSLTTRPSATRGGRERIAYRDLGVEELGAVYETLLDYQPAWHGHGRQRSLRLQRGSDLRKSSGSFYTPQAIARYVVRRTLAPLVAERTPDGILALRVLDPSMGSGAFLVAACAFLAEAYEDALVASGSCQPHDVADSDRAHIRRLIAERCLFGVDINPMAVQLARLSLWLATLAADRPLSFLDHHLRTGDSLVGAWLSSLVRNPGGGRRSPHQIDAPRLFDSDGFTSAARSVVPARFSLAGPDDTVEQVRDKERQLARLERPDSELSRWRQVADLWCAAWFGSGGVNGSPTAFGALADVILRGHGDLPSHVAAPLLANAADEARRRHFFHWELEFPEVFFGHDGHRRHDAGFDAIVGNPPWDMIRGDRGDREERDRARREASQMVRFRRDAGVYDVTGHGHVNRYQLFVERSIALLRMGGRLGLVLPGGILSDQASTPVRRRLFADCAVDGVVAFDNRRAVFPIHRSMRIALLTATKGAPTQQFGLRSGDTDPSVLEQDDSGSAPWFPVALSYPLLQRLSGDDLSIPDVRLPIDLAITERACRRFAPLGSHDGWSVEFGRELNATDDRHLLSLTGHGLPVVEGKLLAPFAVDLGGVTHRVRPREAVRKLGRRVERARLAYRDVASATNRQTLIAALLPAATASTHTVFCLRTPLPLVAQHFLCGLFNSFVVNYFVRQRVATHVTTTIVERLPVPTRPEAGALFREIAAFARLLSRAPARQSTGGPGPAAPVRPRTGSAGATGGGRADRAALLAGLNARVAQLYGLTVAEYAHVVSTFPLVPQPERERSVEVYRGRS